MRFSTLILLAVLGTPGCGGYVVLEKRTEVPPPPPRRAPAPPPVCAVREVSRQEAVDIAVSEASRRHFHRLSLRDIERHKREWRVELWGRADHGREGEIRVKIHRVTGDVLSYKCKLEHRRKHEHHHDDDDDDDDD
jgi:hypothetical protein